MSTILRRYVMPVVAAAAVFAAAAPAHTHAASAARPGRVLADQICPDGSNWNNIINACD